jgi:Flp pilus assembly protein TadD
MTLKPDSNPTGGQAQNNTFENINHHQRGLQLAEAGRYQDALVCMQEHLRTAPDDAEVLNDTGAILHCLGRSNEAIDYFVKAQRLRNDSAEIVWNLAEAYLATGRATEAMQLFDKMEEMSVLNADDSGNSLQEA